MAYKYTTGSVHRGDIYSEDDSDKNTFIDWDNGGLKDRVSIIASGSMVFDVIGHAGPNLISDASSSAFSADPAGGWPAEGVAGGGVILKFDDAQVSTTPGLVYYLKANGTWVASQANNGATGATGSLVAMATGPNSGIGMQLNGFINVAAARLSGSVEKGAPAYLAPGTAGELSFALPSGSGNVVRIMGQCVDIDGSGNILLYFNPSSDWVVLS
jgi:hypothetical protein|tara:strand:+ start:1426 stop:2067 length:642 start_codon:yes stop_codon:yes gene_type:complete